WRYRAKAQIWGFGSIEEVQGSRQDRAIGRSSRDGHDPRRTENDRRQVHDRDEHGHWQRPTPWWPLRENQREVQQERRQQRHRDRLTPVEGPSQGVKRPVEGGGEVADKR